MMHVNRPGPSADILYDEDCGLCRWVLAKVLAWDRRRALRPVAIQSAEGGELLADLSEEQRLASWHLIREGHRYSAGGAFPPLLVLLPGGRPLARLAKGRSGATERAYRLVADNRSAFGRLIPGGAKRRADERIRRRAAATAAR